MKENFKYVRVRPRNHTARPFLDDPRSLRRGLERGKVGRPQQERFAGHLQMLVRCGPRRRLINSTASHVDCDPTEKRTFAASRVATENQATVAFSKRVSNWLA